MKKVLIVDDNREIRNLVRLSLPFAEFQSQDTDNGSDAVRLIKEWRPDLVLLDIMMPGELDGLQVCQQVKQDAAVKDTIIVLLTALGSSGDIQEGYSVGANAYIVKPFSPSELATKVRQLLEMGCAPPPTRPANS